jgi:hypothetical protein
MRDTTSQTKRRGSILVSTTAIDEDDHNDWETSLRNRVKYRDIVPFHTHSLVPMALPLWTWNAASCSICIFGEVIIL